MPTLLGKFDISPQLCFAIIQMTTLEQCDLGPTVSYGHNKMLSFSDGTCIRLHSVNRIVGYIYLVDFVEHAKNEIVILGRLHIIMRRLRRM